MPFSIINTIIMVTITLFLDANIRLHSTPRIEPASLAAFITTRTSQRFDSSHKTRLLNFPTGEIVL